MAKQIKKVKAWAVTKDDSLLECYPMSSGVFMKRIYNTEETARNQARKLPNEWDIKVVPIEIIYKI